VDENQLMLSHRGRANLVGLVIVVAVVAFLYSTGRLDSLLYRFGLNHNPCTHAVSGQVVCGPDITGTPFNTNQGGGGGGGSAPNPAGAAGGVGQSVSGSLGKSGSSAP
jgi:hypothetical protein